MKSIKLLALAIAAIGFTSAAQATVVTYADFTTSADLTLNGNTALTTTSDGNVLRLTPATTGQSGSAFSTTAVNLGSGGKFSTFFQFRFTNPGGIDAADGITFTLQNVSSSIGSSGGGLGYAGISNSVAVEFDTFDNGEGDNNHVAVDTAGGLQNFSKSNPGGETSCHLGDVVGKSNCLANGNIWSVWVDYDGTNLKVALADGSSIRPADIIDYAIDIPTILGANTAFVGFTAGTGSGYENQDILNWQFINDFAPITGPIDPGTSDVPTPDSLALLGIGLTGLGAFTRRRNSK